MNALLPDFVASRLDGLAQLRAAAARIAPQWPLASFIAVNPFMGYVDLDVTDAAARLRQTHGAQLLPGTSAASQLTSLAAWVGTRKGFDGEAFVQERISQWAASHLDLNRRDGRMSGDGDALFAAWREETRLDPTPDIYGVGHVRRELGRLPGSADQCVRHLLDELDLPEEACALYLERLAGSMAGWMALVRHIDWTLERDGGRGHLAEALLCIRLVWDVLLARPYGVEALHEALQSALADQADLRPDLSDLEAQEAQWLGEVSHQLKAPPSPAAKGQIKAVFCIDVRSERLRRHLEAVSPDVTTVGFAGFFGLALGVREPMGVRPSCPALLPARFTCEVPQTERPGKGLSHALKDLKAKGGAALAYVESLGATSAGAIAELAMGWTRAAPTRHDPVRWADTPDLDALTQTAAGFLKASGLNADLTPCVILVGHEAQARNNPHLAGLQCGACGGRSGADNARMMSDLLNASEVRQRLQAQHGIAIPASTRFFAAVHNTTTDQVALLDQVHDPLIDRFRQACERAAVFVRAERAALLGETPDLAALSRRAADPSEVRPEWGLAGCAGFMAAPRALTRGKNLEGRVFLHDYVSANDPDGATLEQILTAPVIVASWINLQYLASSLAPDVFGAGDKTLHNIVGGGLGVFEGNGGDLRLGLPRQSVHDGEMLRYPPQRLSVMLAADTARIEAVLQKHAGLRHLVENRWMRLFSLAPDGQIDKERTRSGWEAR